jgi:DNA-binding MarR family transcriptional regulator
MLNTGQAKYLTGEAQVMTSGRRAHPGFLCGAHEQEEHGALEVFEADLLRLIWLEQKRLAQTLAAHGLTFSQFLVMASIWERQEGCPMSDLAGQMLQSSATMTGIVDRLVRLQLVRRQSVPADRRVIVVGLTERGRDLIVRVRAEKRADLDRILGLMPAGEGSLFMRLLHNYLDVSVR